MIVLTLECDFKFRDSFPFLWYWKITQVKIVSNILLKTDFVKKMSSGVKVFETVNLILPRFNKNSMTFQNTVVIYKLDKNGWMWPYVWGKLETPEIWVTRLSTCASVVIKILVRWQCIFCRISRCWRDRKWMRGGRGGRFSGSV